MGQQNDMALYLYLQQPLIFASYIPLLLRLEGWYEMEVKTKELLKPIDMNTNIRTISSPAASFVLRVFPAWLPSARNPIPLGTNAPQLVSAPARVVSVVHHPRLNRMFDKDRRTQEA